MSWRIYRNLENSLYEYLREQIDNNWSNVTVRIARFPSTDISLPQVCLYWDSSTLSLLEIGSNILDERNLMIIEVYATSDGQLRDLVSFLIDVLKDGFNYYTYQPAQNEQGYTKSLSGYVTVRFIENRIIPAPDNADLYEKFRHRLAISCSLIRGG